jgi:hypothetical protein
MVGDGEKVMGSTLRLQLSNINPFMSLLANRPTKLIRVEPASSSPAETMSSLLNYVGTHRSPLAFLMALKGTFPLSVFQKM